MVGEYTKNIFKNPYNKLVQKDFNSSNSSLIDEKFDHLSYSYSCIKAFKDNKAIIGNLTAQHDAQYQGLAYQPTLFSLSGMRDKPICQPFYYSTSPEIDPVSQPDYRKNVHSVESLNLGQALNTQGVGFEEFPEQEFFNKKLFIQWLKCRFQYINSFWPYIKDSFLPKACHKNQQIKIEMLLNQMDEKAKYRLKEYVNDLKLTIQERHSLCNESVIEIDITPLMAHPNQLQAFLQFLQCIEANESKAVRGSTKSYPKVSKSFPNKVTLKDKIIENQELKINSLFHQHENGDSKTSEGTKPSMISGGLWHDKRNCLETSNVGHLNFDSIKRCRRMVKEDIINKTQHLSGLNFLESDISQDCFEHNMMHINKNSNRITPILDISRGSQITSTQYNQKSHDDDTERKAKGDNINPIQNVFYTQPKLLNNHGNIFVKKKYAHKIDPCKCSQHAFENLNGYKEPYWFGKGIEENNSFECLDYKDNDLKTKVDLSSSSKDTNMHFTVKREKIFQNGNIFPKVGKKRFSLIGDEEEIVLHKRKRTALTRKCFSNPIINSKIGPYWTNQFYKYKRTQIKNFKNKSEHTVKNFVLENIEELSEKKITGNAHMKHENQNSEYSCASDYSNEDFRSERLNESEQYTRRKTIHANKMCEQFLINACYESFNYNINSIAWNKSNFNKPKCTIRPTSNSEPYFSSHYITSDKMDSFSLCSSCCTYKRNSEESGKNISLTNIYTGKSDSESSGTIKEQSNNHYEYILLNDENNNNEKRLDYKQEYKIRLYKQSNDENKYERSIKLNERKIEKNNSKILNNYKSTTNGKDKHRLKTDSEEFNSHDFNKKIGFLCENNNLKHDNVAYFSTNQSAKPENMHMIIKIHQNTENENEMNTSKMSKNHLKLNSLKPKNIYGSLSSIFKRHGGNQNVKNMDNFKINVSKNSDMNKTINESKHCNYTKKLQHSDCFTSTATADGQTHCSDALSKDLSLILKNLDKLFLEVRNHRGEIDLMKKYLYECIN